MAKKWKKKIPTIKHKKNAVKHLKQQKNILESAESKNIDLSEICAVLDKKDLESLKSGNINVEEEKILKSENTKVKDGGLPMESSAMEVDKPQSRYHPKTFKNEHGNYPIWMNSRAIKKLKAKLKHRSYKRRGNKNKQKI